MNLRRIASAVRARPATFGIVAVAVAVAALVAVRAVASAPAFELVSADSDAADEEALIDEAGASSEADDVVQTVFVHVTGCVTSPGLYELPEGSRVADAVAAAGGLSEGASSDGVNLARIVSDGEQIAVPTEGEAAATATEASKGTTGGKVNINTATAEELDTLPGIGPATAAKIIADREANGPFTSPEDIKRVSGIGDAKYADLADAICV